VIIREVLHSLAPHEALRFGNTNDVSSTLDKLIDNEPFVDTEPEISILSHPVTNQTVQLGPLRLD
jgi:hypothetical protein